jgi:hypothetical protein
VKKYGGANVASLSFQIPTILTQANTSPNLRVSIFKLKFRLELKNKIHQGVFRKQSPTF